MVQLPRLHQIEAIAACVSGLRKPHSRGQCIMACGTGKTLVGYEVAQGLKAKRLLTLVPSLLLVNQMIREYRARGANNILSVCSDESAGGEDAIQISVKELEADNTTDAKVARAFLDGPGQRIVVCTYQSLRNLAEVFDGLAFDLAIFDEAHKTAGRKSKLFAHALQDNGLKCARRLFMTATPRHSALKDDGEESQVFAMNDPKVYGPVLYSLPLRTAIEASIIDDYRIVVAVVSQQKTDDMREQAIRVAIDRARKEFGIGKVFTFHSRVADAAGFILGATDTLMGMRLYHVSGQQSSRERGLKLEGFRAADAALMSNARCLTEGVDLPAADMVAFLSPKKNPIDIVQAVGRVLRKHHSKAKGGYVFLPVFVRDGKDEEAAIAESDWSGCYEVLQAMREQDEPLSVKLSKCARGDGELPEQIEVMDGRKRGGEELESDRVQFSEGMRRAIRVKVVKPFNRDPDGKKKELLRMARAGEPRPHRGKLSQSLADYCSRRGVAFDATFARQVHGLAPHWFTFHQSSNRKEELLTMARLGKPRPSADPRSEPDKNKRQLGDALKRYTNPKRCYDKHFDLEVRRLAPHWFVDTVANNKAELLALAKAGSSRPAHGSKLGMTLQHYLINDNAFCQELKAIAPSRWFHATDPKAKKDTLLALALEGKARPSWRTQLGQALSSYTRNSSSYDATFDVDIRRLAPLWFTGASSRVKSNLLEMARTGQPKPTFHAIDVRESSLRSALNRYMNPKSVTFDGTFASELRRLAPHWFRKTKESK
jgi:superfamily II DNA or RNA helicase